MDQETLSNHGLEYWSHNDSNWFNFAKKHKPQGFFSFNSNNQEMKFMGIIIVYTVLLLIRAIHVNIILLIRIMVILIKLPKFQFNDLIFE